ncbi:MAG TPA: metallophosphoesterase [Herpetosiphonaceae bacterium]|nr:metallophosphoesterase [Herpetosiphonaceae bacterium]
MAQQHPFEYLEPVPRGSKGGPVDPHHLVYSRRWVAGAAAFGLASAGGLVGLRPAARRRWALRWLAGLAGAGLGLGLAGLAGIWRLLVERHTLRLPGWPAALDGLRVAHLSDLHFGPGYTRHVLRRALAEVGDFRPDLIVLTGDFADTPEDLPRLREMLAGLDAPLGVYACLGNHDYWDDPAEVAGILHGLGFTVLVNHHRVLSWRGEPFVLAGVADPWQSDADLAAALDGAPDGLPVLLMAHGPDFFATAADHPVALQFSGHAHAGHINLPILGPLVLPRWGVEYPNGVFQLGRSVAYVSRGLGGLPFRLGAAPEVGLLTLAAGGDELSRRPSPR